MADAKQKDIVTAVDAVDKDAVVQKRLFVRGLKEDVASEELAARFRSFGKVVSVDLAGGGPTGGCRGFGYVSLEATPASIGKCLSVYNGSKWKGMQLHLEEAKQDYKTKLKREWAQIQSQEEAHKSEKAPTMSKRKRKKLAVEMASDMSLVTDRNVKNRKNWRQSRFGRAVSVYKYRDPATGRIVIVDPLRHKNNITRPESYAQYTPVNKLLWPSDDIVAPKSRRELALELALAEEAEEKAAREEREGGLFAESDDEPEPAQFKALDVTALYGDEHGTESESEESDDDLDAAGLFSDAMDVDRNAKEDNSKKVILRYDDEPMDFDDDDDFEVVPSTAPRIVLPSGFSDDSDKDVPSLVPPPRSTSGDPQLNKERSLLLGLAKSLVGKDPEIPTEAEAAAAIPEVDTPTVELMLKVETSSQHPFVNSLTQDSEDAEAIATAPALTDPAAIPEVNPETVELMQKVEHHDEQVKQASGVTTMDLASQVCDGGEGSSEAGTERNLNDFDHDIFGTSSTSDGEDIFKPVGYDLLLAVSRKLEAVAANQSNTDSEISTKPNSSVISATDVENGISSIYPTIGDAVRQALQGAALDEDDHEPGTSSDDESDANDSNGPPLPPQIADLMDVDPEPSSLDHNQEDQPSNVAAEPAQAAKPIPLKPAVPVALPGDRHYAVNTNLRALLFADNDADDAPAPFSLFGEPAEAPASEGPDLFARPAAPSFELFPRNPAAPSPEAQTERQEDAAEVARSFNTSRLFFFHIGNPALAHRSIYAPDGTFMRTETEDEIKMTWEDSRIELTQDFKSKHKLASRKKDRKEKMKGPRKGRPS